ncbi:MAG: class I SAM-dependent methyltransferase [Thermoanaerobaculia bacterium]
MAEPVDSHDCRAGRFTGRVADYVRARPGYPPALLDFLADRGAIFPGAIVADVGSGTGLFTELLLAAGVRVHAVEPNAEMRAAAEARLGGRQEFHSVDGRAEATGLPERSVDLVVAAQAFHWFDPRATRAEWHRILRPPGRAALIWNARRASGTPFLERYEQLLLDFGTDYGSVGHRGVSAERLADFFGAPPATFRAENVQRLDREGVRARLLSSSYIPAAGTDRHREMLAALDELFDATAVEGEIAMAYDTELFLGELRGAADDEERRGREVR